MNYQWAVLCLVLFANFCQAQYSPEKFSWGDFGTTEIYSGGSNGLELILTDDASMQDARSLAAHLSQTGKVAAILSIDTYLQQISLTQKSCFDAATPLSVYAQDVQQQHHFFHFEPAFITGLGHAGEYLFAMLSQTPKGIFRGAFSVQTDDDIQLPVNLCRPNPAVSWDAKSHQTRLNVQLLPATPWRSVSVNHWIKPWLQATVPQQSWRAARDQFEQQLFQPTQATSADISSLPLVEVNPEAQAIYAHSDVFAVVISGDGGWANIDKDIANGLAAKGIAVVGWNSLEYFWEGKTPDIAGRDLQQVLDYYGQRWHKHKIMLIGFSMGADVMPFMINRLNANTQQQLLSVSLLNPSTSVDFTFHLSGWLNTHNKAPYSLYPEVKDWRQWATNCFYSTREQSLCARLEQSATLPAQQQLFFLAGDHHFNGNVEQLIDLIISHTPSLE
jgi:type IV secretory pathway VirJ component